MTVVRRTWQFLSAWRAKVSPGELSSASHWLSIDQAHLFRRMSAWDQRHCLDVFYHLQKSGCQDPALLQAALLHDCGKSGAGITIWHRVVFVLAESLLPGWLGKLSTWKGQRFPFVVFLGPLVAIRHHPERGARLAAIAGCSPAVQDYIRRHHDAYTPGPLALLRQADGQSVSKEEVEICLESVLSEQA